MLPVERPAQKKESQAWYVTNISSAREALAKQPPSLMFIDNHLPDGLGINFISEVKQHYPTVKIVMITADDSASDKKNALKGGADKFIGKPFSGDIILSAVDSLIN